MPSTSSVLFIIVITVVWCGPNIPRRRNTLVANQAPQVAEQIFSILTTGVLSTISECLEVPSGFEIQYWLYTQQNPNHPTLLNSFIQIDADKPIVFLVHGWNGNRDVHYIQAVKNGYLPKNDYNIIIVDYGEYVNGNYFSAYCKVPFLGAAFGNYICKLCNALGISPSSIHIVGHSLGAQVGGIAGNRCTCGKIGRITGLDPAGPLYQDIDPAMRLDKTDAMFVDVIHTNQAQYGYIGDCGHVDFYPNCGIYQPGCLNATAMQQIRSIWDIHHFAISTIECSHQRSCYLFKESIEYNNFLASPCWFGCGLSQLICMPNPFRKQVYMGEYLLRSEPSHQQYALFTKSEPPYSYDYDLFMDF